MTHSDTLVDPAPFVAAKSAVRATDISVHFGGVVALDDVTVDVAPDSIVGLIGPNGAGKSTLLGVLSGTVRPTSGKVYIGEKEVTSTPPQARAGLGLARTFQTPELFAELTVREHLVLGFRAQNERSRLLSDLFSGRGLTSPSKAETERVDGLIELLEMGDIAHRQVLELPLGATRLVEAGRALSTKPKVLLLDEPSSGLDRMETERLTTALSRIVRDEHVAVILVEHDVEMVLGLSEKIYVLDFGALIAAGSSAEVRADSKVRAAYLGNEGQGAQTPHRVTRVTSTPGPGKIATPILEVEHLSVFYGSAQALSDVSLEVTEGSAVAVLGVNGAGKSTLSRAVCGLVPSRQGRITFDGHDVTKAHPHEIFRLGLAYLPEGRGVFPGLSVKENLKMAVQTIPRSERDAAMSRAIDLFPVLGARPRQLAANLSGGEQQMLSLARALSITPRLVIGDELSLGLAPLIIDTVFEGLERARDAGLTVIIIEQFIQRALAFADYGYILNRGSVVWRGEASTAGDDVVRHYLGGDEGGESTL